MQLKNILGDFWILQDQGIRSTEINEYIYCKCSCNKVLLVTARNLDSSAGTQHQWPESFLKIFILHFL